MLNQKEARLRKYERRMNRLKRGDKWPKDSANEKLSYTKMKYEVMRSKVNHLKGGDSAIAQLEEDADMIDIDNLPTYKRFNCCVSVGNFCGCCRNLEHSPLQKPLGIGVILYFKQLKNLIGLMFFCTLLSLPQLAIFWGGAMTMNPDVKWDSTIQQYVTAFTLANLDDAQQTWKT